MSDAATPGVFGRDALRAEPREAVHARPIELPHEHRLGSAAMLLTIATEAALFGSLFFAYVLLSHGDLRWLGEPAPKLPKALAMLAILLSSSAVLAAAEIAAKHGTRTLARGLVLVTAALGVAFLVVQALEYRERLKVLTPQTDAYGSIFYTITGLHGLHVASGILMLLFVAGLRAPDSHEREPHRALHSAAMYWHFVDLVWIAIVTLLYVVPSFGR